MSSKGGWDQRWVLTDQFGRVWRLTFTRWPAAAAMVSRASAPAAALRALVDDAFAPWGTASRSSIATLIEICDAVGGYSFFRDDLHGKRLGSGWRDRLEIVNEALVRALESGRLLCEPVHRHAPAIDEEKPDPLRELPPRETEDGTWFELRVVDEVGAALSGLDVAFAVAGQRRVLTTDSDGMVRVDGAEVSAASATVSSLASLRGLLGARWKKPRAARVPEGEHVSIREIDDATRPLSLTSETPATLVITPAFRCYEIAGAHFEFGRSFVRREALQNLADIAEALRGDAGRKAMIFGHSDRSGSELVNKELSERRGKAIFCLFTHDAAGWEELFSGTADGPHWKEKWGVLEAQHMMNALGVTDDAGKPIKESGVRDASTKQAIARFRAGDYPDRPVEQRLLPPAPMLGADGRTELFLAYAKRVTRTPIDSSRIAEIGSSKFMGCGEFNPLSVTAKDTESRRAVVLVFDPAAQPEGLPCQLRSVAPCRAASGPPVSVPDPDGKPPYRCKVYQEVASRCPCQGGVDLSHDLVVRFPITLRTAGELPHVYVLASEDGTIHQEQTLAGDARANDFERAEIAFEDLPETHLYRLTCRQNGEEYELFGLTNLADLQDRADRTSLADLGDSAAMNDHWLENENAPAKEEDASDSADDPGDDGAPMNASDGGTA